MRDAKRKRRGWAARVLPVLLVVAGCNPVVRHRVLTFFFDGVPPLNAKTARSAEDPNRAMADAGAAPQVVMFWHEPARDCQRCHENEIRTGAPTLIEPVPRLCYGCHENETLMKRVAHGPVAVGACLFCHDAHKSRYQGLLTAPQPELCYRCHDENLVAQIEAHQRFPSNNCTRCHEPHAGSQRMLLKMRPGPTARWVQPQTTTRKTE